MATGSTVQFPAEFEELNLVYNLAVSELSEGSWIKLRASVIIKEAAD